MKQMKGWIIPHFKQQFWRFVLTAMFGTLATAFAGALLFTSGYLISRSSMQPENILLVYVPIVLVRTFGFGKAALQYVYRLLSHDVVLRILSKMRVRLFSMIEPQALFIRSRFRSGDLLVMLAEDIEELQHVYLRVVLPTITAIVIYSVGILLIGWFDVPFALLMALYSGVILFGIPFMTLLRSRRQRRQFAKEKNKAYEKVTDAVFGMTDWKLSGRTEHFIEKFNRQQDRMNVPEQFVRRKEWNMQWISQALIGGAVLLMAIWASKWEQIGLIQPEWIAAFTLIVFPLLEEFVRTGEAIVRTPDYEMSIKRLKQVEAQSNDSEQMAALEMSSKNVGRLQSPEGNNLSGQVQASSSDGDSADVGANLQSSSVDAALGKFGLQSPAIDTTLDRFGSQSLAIDTTLDRLDWQSSQSSASSVDLKLQRVTYRYSRMDEPAVQDVTLDIPMGSKVAVIGKSGSGKSTLLKLIQGELKPAEGDVTANGAPTYAFAQNDGSASLFSVLNQKPYLFDTTMANNIKLARPTATMAEVEKAAELAGLSELISRLPEGLQTRVLESGLRFSGGERQRIALARILLQDTPIVLLDEPTVGLDPIVENRLIETIFQALDGKTIVWITHHLRFLEHMDRVIFFDQGRVLMDGSHDELLRSSERYRKLYELDR